MRIKRKVKDPSSSSYSISIFSLFFPSAQRLFDCINTRIKDMGSVDVGQIENNQKYCIESILLKSLNADKMPSWLWKMYGPNLLDDNFIIKCPVSKASSR